MPTIRYAEDVDVDVYCDKCGTALDADAKTDAYGAYSIYVYPCEGCLEAEYNKGVADTEE